MKSRSSEHRRSIPFPLMAIFAISAVTSWTSGAALAATPLDPTLIPKYVTPLVIPPVMNSTGTPNTYDIAVREFKQQILPAGHPATRVWSYGPTADPIPAVAPAANSQFNYPAYTIETNANTPVNVRWRNELVAIDPGTGHPYPNGDPRRTFLPHFLPLDQTLHWANPPASGCMDGTNRPDCATLNPFPYQGPVPMVTHLHGAHVDPHSDGYPEAWWLPAASNIPAGYARTGTIFDDATGTNPGNLGYADYTYRNDQPATTLWFHDHSLGITRANVYAGPAGFWLIRGGANDGAKNGATNQPAVLPGPAPVAGETVAALNTPSNPVRNKIREIPIVIQDRSFNTDGTLDYPDSRTFFDGFAGPYVPYSDIAPTWNPEAFFNTMVVNGTTWPTMQVAPAKYRLRLLNGCNSRFLNLALFELKQTPNNKTKYGAELPMYQIGAEQGFLPKVVEIKSGFATFLPGNGTIPKRTKAPRDQQALLMGLAERADIIVDFSGFANGTIIRMINTAPDAPFGGFPDLPADPQTTGQVMEFVVNSALTLPSDATTTSPFNLVLNTEQPLGAPTVTRKVSLNEEESTTVCVDPLTNLVIPGATPPNCGAGVPIAPKAAKLGVVDLTSPAAPVGIPLAWSDETSVSQPAQITLQSGAVMTINVSENPTAGNNEIWEIYNFTVDAHPIHLHLVRFEVINREIFDPLFGIPGTFRNKRPTRQGHQVFDPLSAITSPEAGETGYKDTVIAYPGQITRVKAVFDISGLYVWHCHILEHEDNEMMRPFVVSP